MERAGELTAKNWLSAGWTTFRTFPLKLVLGALLLSAPGGLSQLLVGATAAYKNYVFWIAGTIALTSVTSILWVGWAFFCLRLTRGVNVKFWEIFDAFRRWGTALWTSVCVLFVVALGSILLVIPGIIWWLEYCLSFFAVMDRQVSAREAMNLSGRITSGYKWKLFVLFIIFAVPSILGTGIGLLEAYLLSCQPVYLGDAALTLASCVIYPWITLSLAVAYDRCSVAYEEQDQAPINAALNSDLKPYPIFIDTPF